MPTPTRPKPGKRAKGPQPFTHMPRPPWVLPSTAQDSDVWLQYGHGVCADMPAASMIGATVARHKNEPEIAYLRLMIDDGFFFDAGIGLKAEGLRELARCLIDAAAEIDGWSQERAGPAIGCGKANTAFLFAPPGAGKSTVARDLAARLGCTHVVDEWRPGLPVLPGALHLSHAPVQDILQGGAA